MANDTIFTETLVNTSDTAKQVVFIITPYIRENTSESVKCTGPAHTVKVWVEPTPKVGLTPTQDTICTALRTRVQLSTVTRSLQPVRFYYEAQYNPSVVSVFYAKDTFDIPPGYTLADSIVNLTTVPQKVTIVTYPYLKGQGDTRRCPGNSVSADIWIAPTLHATVDSISTFIGGRNIKCRGDNTGFIRLMPDGGVIAFTNDVSDISYKWSNNKFTKDISKLYAGTYSITIKDRFNCLDNKTFTLTQPDAVLKDSIVIVQNVSCFGSDGILEAGAQGGTQNYDFVWTKVPEDFGEEPDIHRRKLTNAPEGRYYLTVYDTNRCQTTSIWKDLTQPSAKFVGAYPIDYGKFQIKCNGESNGGWVTVNNSMTSIIYRWTGPNGFVDTFTNASLYNYQYNLPAGRYTLHYSDIAECEDVFIVDLLEPDPLVIDTSTLSKYNSLYNVSCFGLSDGHITLNSIRGGHGINGYFYNWKSLTGGNLSDSTLRNQTGLEAGRYSVVVSDSFNCAVSDTFDLIQPSEIKSMHEESHSIAGGHNLNCFGDNNGSIVLDPEGGDTKTAPYQISWQQGSTAAELHNLVAGDYIVTIKDGINCSITDTIPLTEPDKLQIEPLQISDHNGYEVSCYGGSDGNIRILATGGEGNYRYDWTNDNIPLRTRILLI